MRTGFVAEMTVRLDLPIVLIAMLILPALGSAAGQTKESPYETVMRLKREAAAKQSQPTAAAMSIGPVVARAELKLVPPFQFHPGSWLGFQRQDTTTVKPVSILETPSDAPREPVYFPVRVGGGEIQGITYRSMRPPGEVMLILDLDGDGLWSDEKAYVGKRDQLMSVLCDVLVRPGVSQAGQLASRGAMRSTRSAPTANG